MNMPVDLVLLDCKSIFAANQPEFGAFLGNRQVVLHILQVTMRLNDGPDNVQPVWKTPEKDPLNLSGSSYVERLLRSAAACCPLGLNISTTKHSKGGYVQAGSSRTPSRARSHSTSLQYVHHGLS